jgi:hypothetical protein
MEHFFPLPAGEPPHSDPYTSRRQGLAQVICPPGESFIHQLSGDFRCELCFFTKRLQPPLSSDPIARNEPYPINPAGNSDRPALADPAVRHPEGCKHGAGRRWRGPGGSGTLWPIVSSVRFFFQFTRVDRQTISPLQTYLTATPHSPRARA